MSKKTPARGSEGVEGEKMRTVILLIIAIVMSMFLCSCSGSGKEPELTRTLTVAEEKLIEIGQEQWAKDYIGDTNRKPSQEEALLAAKRANAYTNLKKILDAEFSYFDEHNLITENFVELKLGEPQDGVYSYSVETLGEKRLRINATANLDGDEYKDHLVMDELGSIEIVEDDLRNWRKGDGILKPDRLIQKARNVERVLQESMDRRMEGLETE